ncbi:MAG: fimbria/pilus periplasmic chaperone [Rhizomicrobium sp.]|jgi:P pilus assembly chaperone PapD
MRKSLKVAVRTLVSALCILGLAVNAASAMTVQPVVVDLKPNGGKMSATISVQNTATTPLPVELTAKVLEFTEDGAKPTVPDPGDLLIFPPQALIPPGQTQTFRIQWVGDPELKQSKSYYVTVAQLPVKLPAGQSAIQILYNFQVLVSVAATTGGPVLSIAKTGIEPDPKTKKPEAVIWVQNTGPSYGYLSHGKLDLSEIDAGGKSVFDKSLSPQDIQQTIGFGVIGPDTTRKILVPIPLPSGQGQIKATFDAGNP